MDKFSVKTEVTAVMAQGDGEGFRVYSDPLVLRRIPGTDGLADLLEADLSRARKEGLHWAGVISYGAAPAFDPALPGSPSGLPAAEWGLFRSMESLSAPDLMTEGCPGTGGGEGLPMPFLAPLQPRMDDAAYKAAFTGVREGLAAGRSYQMNLTFSLDTRLCPVLPRAGLSQAGEGYRGGGASGEGSSATGCIDRDAWWRLWTGLQAGCPARHGAFWYLGAPEGSGPTCIASFSPELFFTLRDGVVTARPMKGTAPRMQDPAEDIGMKAALEASAKDRAENLMITDMIRNDLGKVADPGTVEVPRLFEVETLSTVHQMTSTVTARCRRGMPALLNALFPCASITGAPKKSTMEALSVLEVDPRDWYTGAAGWVDPAGNGSFSVLIRTLHARPEGTCRLGVGGGVTWDSLPGAEREEALWKARFLGPALRDFSLVEALRWSPETLAGLKGPDGIADGPGEGGFWFPDAHLDRLARSAECFGTAFVRTGAMDVLIRGAREFRGRWKESRVPEAKVRLLLGPEGDLHAEFHPLDRPFNGEDTQTFAPCSRPSEPGARDRVFLVHKTDRRDWYAQRAASGADQTVFWDGEGRLLEASTANIALLRDGVWLTPRWRPSFLGGAYRQVLLAAGRLREADLTLADLAAGEPVFLLNSVRGWIPAARA